MCGLVGMWGNILQTDKRVAQELLVVSALRGPHSTGSGIVGKSNRGSYFKTAHDPFGHLEFKDERKDVKKIFKSTQDFFDTGWPDAKVWMGHNRYATVGNVDSSNAHPFYDENDKVLFAHNGHIANHYELCRQMKVPGKQWDVDSEVACNYLARFGIQKLLEEGNGAFCYTWWDNEAETFNIIRNNDRPIWIAKHHHRDTWYYASEPKMLEWILDRNKIDFENPTQPFAGDHIVWSPKEAGKIITTKRNLFKVYNKHTRGIESTEDIYDQMYGNMGYAAAWQEDNEGKPKGGRFHAPSYHPVNPVRPPYAGPNNLPVVREQSKSNNKTFARDFDRGRKWLEDHKGLLNTRYVGWFDTFTSFSPNVSWKQKPSHDVFGRAFGYFDDPEAVEDCLIEVQGVNLYDFWNTDTNSFDENWYSFVLHSCAWDEEHNQYVILGGQLEYANQQKFENWKLIKPNESDLAAAEAMFNPVSLAVETEDKKILSLPSKPTDLYKVFGNSFVQTSTWLAKTVTGCFKCRKMVGLTQANELEWFTEEEFLCGACSAEYHTEQKRKLAAESAVLNAVH